MKGEYSTINIVTYRNIITILKGNYSTINIHTHIYIYIYIIFYIYIYIYIHVAYFNRKGFSYDTLITCKHLRAFCIIIIVLSHERGSITEI